MPTVSESRDPGVKVDGGMRKDRPGESDGRGVDDFPLEAESEAFRKRVEAYQRDEERKRSWHDSDAEAREIRDSLLYESVLADRCENTMVGRYLHDLRTGAWASKNVDTSIWNRSATKEVLELIENTIRCTIEALVPKVHRPQSLKQIAKEPIYRHVRHILEGRTTLDATKIEYDRLAYLLGTPLGVYDLRTGQLAEKSEVAQDHVSRSTAVAPDHNLKTPNWTRFLKYLCGDDDELLSFLRLVLGYCVTGETREQLCFVLLGSPGTGKNTLVEAVRVCLGGYAASTRVTHFTEGFHEHTQWLAKLDGARWCQSQQPASGSVWKSDVVAELISGETQEANFMRQNSFTFVPVLKLIFPANDMPRLRGGQEGMERRVCILPLNRVVPKDKIDPRLRAKIEKEGPGILADLIACAKEYYTIEKPLIEHAPKCVSDAKARYLEEQDSVAAWLDDSEYVLDPNGKCPVKHVNEDYNTWCRNNHIRALSRKQFIELLEGDKYRCTRETTRIDGKVVKVWIGLRRMPENEPTGSY